MYDKTVFQVTYAYWAMESDSYFMHFNNLT